MSNQFSRFVEKVNYVPKQLRPYILTKFFCLKVKFAGTANINIHYVSQDLVKITLKNKPKVQNHIGGIHAIAAAVLAESATGIVFGMNVPDDSLPLLKSMHIDYQRRMQGSLSATAQMTKDQQKNIVATDNGSLIIPVIIKDDSGQEPIVCKMEWAWVKKKRKSTVSDIK